jgi:hypothetical protein
MPAAYHRQFDKGRPRQIYLAAPITGKKRWFRQGDDVGVVEHSTTLHEYFHQARQRCLLHPSNRAGRNNKAWIKANIAPTVIPRRRKGKDTSQTKGKRTRASNATGQHSTNRMHHRTKSSRTFIFLAFKFVASHSTPVNDNKPFRAGDVKCECRMC